MSRMDKYFEELHLAEFGDDESGIEENPREFKKLLKRAMTWKSFENVQAVVEYLGLDDGEDSRLESLEGCKELIGECIK